MNKSTLIKLYAPYLLMVIVGLVFFGKAILTKQMMMGAAGIVLIAFASIHVTILKLINKK